MGDPAAMARILVVEDNDDTADLVCTRLRLAGMEPVLCVSGAEAKAMLAESTFDAVLLDVLMPGVGGYEILQHIRSTPPIQRLPVIMLTAKGGPIETEKALGLGADAYITKPFSPLDLANQLRTLIAKRHPPQRAVAR